MQNIKPKFTPRPWRFRDKTYGKYRFLTVVNDASPMVIIANMPSLHDIPLREWKNAYDIDEVAANAALIAAAPEMYALLERLEQLGEKAKIYPMLALEKKLLDIIEETRRILAKARGE